MRSGARPAPTTRPARRPANPALAPSPGGSATPVRAASTAGGRSRPPPRRFSRAPSARLVIFADEAVEQAQAEGGGALGDGRRVALRPRHPGDIEMRPRHLVDEALDELGADRRAGA